jgi:hypothetical protein
MKKSEALNILGLQDGFTDEELKKAHRAKVVENHPDRFQDPEQKAKAEELTKKINEANDVLRSGKWDPEYGPRYHTSSYGGAPYRSPYVSYGQGTGGTWVEIDPEMFRQWAQQAAKQQQAQGYDPFSPFVGYTPPTAEQQAQRAEQDVRIGLIMIAVKVVLCGLLALNGNYYDAALTWSIITYLLLFSSRFGGCSWIVILFTIPFFYSTAGMLEAAAKQGGIFSIGIIGALFVSALYFDFRDVRDAIKRYRVTKKKAESGK